VSSNPKLNFEARQKSSFFRDQALLKDAFISRFTRFDSMIVIWLQTRAGALQLA